MPANEVISREESVTLWSLLCMITNRPEIFEKLWQESDASQREVVMERLISLRQKTHTLVVRPGEEKTGLLVVRLPANEKTGHE